MAPTAEPEALLAAATTPAGTRTQTWTDSDLDWGVTCTAVRYEGRMLSSELILSAPIMTCVELIPLVIVEGFLGSAGAVVWGNFEEHSNHACQSNGEKTRRTIFARYL